MEEGDGECGKSDGDATMVAGDEEGEGVEEDEKDEEGDGDGDVGGR